MNNQIDILAIASALRSIAFKRMNMAMALQSSREAALFLDRARADWLVADQDYRAAERLMLEMRA